MITHLGYGKKGDKMKRVSLVVVFLLLLAPLLYAGTIEDRHFFFNLYNPTTTESYGDDSDHIADSSTGDQVAVNTYTQKTISIYGVKVNEYVQVRIQGRFVDNPYWTTLDTAVFGAASADTDRNQVITVTEDVDFLRVGMLTQGTNGSSQIVVEGKFNNLER